MGVLHKHEMLGVFVFSFFSAVLSSKWNVRLCHLLICCRKMESMHSSKRTWSKQRGKLVWVFWSPLSNGKLKDELFKSLRILLTFPQAAMETLAQNKKIKDESITIQTLTRSQGCLKKYFLKSINAIYGVKNYLHCSKCLLCLFFWACRDFKFSWIWGQ